MFAAGVVVGAAVATRASTRRRATLARGPVAALSNPPADAADLVRSCCAEDDTLDVNGILWLEHVNLVVGDRERAEAFYVDLLGFTPCPSPSFHVNLGRQQLHLSMGTPQVIHGCVGLAVPSLDSVRARMPAAAAELAGTKFAAVEEGSALRVTCPWGNVYRLYPVADDAGPAAEEGLPKLARLQAGIDAGMGVGGQPGIRYIELAVPRRRSAAVGTFYSEQFGCDVQLAADAAVVPVGPSCHLVFRECDADPVAEAAMEGVHIAIYVSDWKGAYERLSALGLTWSNPRFTHLDMCDDFEQARASRQFRFKHIVDPSGERLLELEHETRALRHFQWFKPVHYLPA